MDLSLFQATLIFGIALALCGAGLLVRSASVTALLKAFPRSKRAAYVTMSIGMAWALYRVTQLGEADFGNYKNVIFIGFLAIGLSAFKYAPDFLSVRGTCIIVLLLASGFLKAAWMQYDEPLRLLMVTPVYIGIAMSLYFAYAPYRVRDIFAWLFVVPGRVKTLGLAFLLYGGLVSSVAFAY